MMITSLRIKNFRFIKDMYFSKIENALILVGTNSTGKTGILNAIQAVGGYYTIQNEDFNEKKQNIEIAVTLSVTAEDLKIFHQNGIISKYKKYEAWERDFKAKLPGFENGILAFTFTANRRGEIRYGDGAKKNNQYIKEVFPKIYVIDTKRELTQMQENILTFQEDELLKQMRSGCCLFNRAKKCSHCFSCIGLLNQKMPGELNAFETAKLLEYKLYQMNLTEFTKRVNDKFHKNGGGLDEIHYDMECDTDRFFRVNGQVYNQRRESFRPIESMGTGMRSIYMLSLLEAYVEDANRAASIIMVEDPEIFLHPRMQKVSSEILYRLSKKNQVIFSTHSPNLLFNFSSKQIRQIYLDGENNSCVKEQTDIDGILDDLGYTANDLMNVHFVFIVEGRQDKSRLPLLLEKYYSEIYDEEGNLSRIAIITTNSCTNIKTYANLKYMNKIYLRDQFLMIRDGDGKDREELARQLCKYYDDRNMEDVDKLPKVTRKNVLVLPYYSFENYFLNPSIMVQIGMLQTEEEFYDILFEKWQEYLHKLRSGKQLTKMLGRSIGTKEELKQHMEEFKIHMRGHNLYDIFYGRFRSMEKDILRRYIELAPREEFADILDPIDKFTYFDSRKRNGV